ncbi:hypothetical protein ABZS98_28015 [Streptomyces avermitilis]|uniref:hypothetical protein n=1 Tax=Streptomyces avermitilis TaxID=33903 RepID=UPI0033AFE282
MNVTLDFGTVVLTVVSMAAGWCVFRWTAPAAPTPPAAPAVGKTTGERLGTALTLTASVAVIMIGSFVVHGIKRVELPQGGPGPIPAVTSKDLPVASPAPTNTGTATGK